MQEYPYIQFDDSGSYVGVGILWAAAGVTPTYPSGCVACTTDQYAAARPWTTLVDGEIVIGTPPPPTLAEQAQAALNAGVTIASTATPALNGTYALDPQSRSNLTSLYSIIHDKNGDAFPPGLTALPYPDISGGVHVFDDVTDFLNFEDAISTYALQLMLIITTGTGTLPVQPTPIP